jgi:hypothetical protein
MARIITTKNDLWNWVASHVGDNVTDVEVDIITNQIQAQRHPRWGTDWTDYLASLPEYLIELVPLD